MPELYHGLFLPRPFQFILHELSHHFTLCNVAGESTVEGHREEEFGRFEIFESHIHRLKVRAG
jgi:hypothetical protein